MGYKNKQGVWKLSPADYRKNKERKQNRVNWPIIDDTKHQPTRIVIPRNEIQFEYDRLVEDMKLYRQRYHNNLQYKYHKAELIPVFRGKNGRPIFNHYDLQNDVYSINYTAHQIRYIRYIAKCFGVYLVG